MTTPQGIAAALRAIEEPANPTPDLMSAVDAAVQQSLANIDNMVASAAQHLDSGSPNLTDIQGAAERAKASIQTSGESAKADLDNLWTDVADVLVAIDRAADAIGAV
ncbi:hypothetical protein [Amycolatopsis sp. NPDC004378]